MQQTLSAKLCWTLLAFFLEGMSYFDPILQRKTDSTRQCQCQSPLTILPGCCECEKDRDRQTARKISIMMPASALISSYLTAVLRELYICVCVYACKSIMCVWYKSFSCSTVFISCAASSKVPLQLKRRTDASMGEDRHALMNYWESATIKSDCV